METPTVLLLSIHKTGLTDDFSFHEALTLLPLATQAQILKKKFQKDQIRALCNQLLQKYGVLKHVTISRNELIWGRGEFGKPKLVNYPHIHFSMSNGEDTVCMYIMNSKLNDETNGPDRLDEEVGIDIASIVDLAKVEDLQLYKGNVFTVVEFNHLESFKDDLQKLKKMFAHYWSLKESYTKLLGTGLNTNLLKIDLGVVDPNDSNICRKINGKDIIFDTKWINEREVVSICHSRTNSLNTSPIFQTVNFTEVIQKLAK